MCVQAMQKSAAKGARPGVGESPHLGDPVAVDTAERLGGAERGGGEARVRGSGPGGLLCVDLLDLRGGKIVAIMDEQANKSVDCDMLRGSARPVRQPRHADQCTSTCEWSGGWAVGVGGRAVPPSQWFWFILLFAGVSERRRELLRGAGGYSQRQGRGPRCGGVYLRGALRVDRGRERDRRGGREGAAEGEGCGEHGLRRMRMTLLCPFG